jgi:hypothetical protein
MDESLPLTETHDQPGIFFLFSWEWESLRRPGWKAVVISGMINDAPALDAAGARIDVI